MKVYTRIVMQWEAATGGYVTVEAESHQYDGPVALCCGADPTQKNIEDQQSQFSQQLVQQAGQVFGDSSSVFKDLMNTFAPTVAAGPNQKGFSAAEDANLRSQAITQTGQAYKNAKAAVGNAEAAQGGGNTDLTAGANIGRDLTLADSAANQTSGELSQIEQANFDTGRKNYDFAVEGMAKAPNVFDAATSAAGAATRQQASTADTANQIAQENQSWMQPIMGAVGSVLGAAASGGMSLGAGALKNRGSGSGSGVGVGGGPSGWGTSEF